MQDNQFYEYASSMLVAAGHMITPSPMYVNHSSNKTLYIDSKKNTDRNGDVRCLCPKCLSDYIHDPNYVVRRLDPFAKSKDNCDKCNNSGWDYIVYDKRTSVKGKGCKNA